MRVVPLSPGGGGPGGGDPRGHDPGRFWLGVGTGEALNEHVIGSVWPEPHVRLKMMQEAIGIIQSS